MTTRRYNVKLKVYVLEIDELSARAKRRLLAGAVLVLIAGASAVVYASVPVTFANGSVLQAPDLNADFDALDQRLARVESASPSAPDAGEAGAPARWIVSRGGKSYSLGATYCGVTPMTMGALTDAGSVAGYAAAKAMCESESACGSPAPSAHMCTAEDLTRTAQLGGTIPQGWYSSGLYAGLPATSGPANDCEGWTTTLPSVAGPSWNSAVGEPTVTGCNLTLAILCCD
jgi:hypothetical protein